MSKTDIETKDVSKKESKREKKERKDEKKKKEKKTKKSKKIDEETPAEEDKESGSDVESDSEGTEVIISKTELDEISIDLNAGVPLSKKQQRLLKKGKLDLAKLARKNPAPKPELSAEDQAKADEEAKKSKKSDFGVWVGNLSFDTTREDLIRFIVGKTAQYYNKEESTSDDDLIKIEEEDISRVNLPKKENKIKGFAYIDFPSTKHVSTVVSLSETVLNGRKLLIKNANSFEGRPAKDTATASLSKNPPSRILFVGNLSFDTTQDLLEEHFRHCGDIVKIRMATFEDTGKCKGFAFIDFKDETGPTTALKSKLAKSLINRPLRLEFGEDRSKRNPNQRKREAGEDFDQERSTARERPVERVESAERPPRFNPENSAKPKPAFKKRPFNDDNSANSKRLKSSVALANAQRASAAIVKSTGKKTTFD